MNRLLIFVALIVLCTSATAQGTSRVVYVNYVSNSLTKESDEDYDVQKGGEIGFLYGQSKAPGHMAGFAGDVAVRYTGNDEEIADRNVDVNTLGGRVGARYYLDIGTPLAQPYLGAGILMQRVRADPKNTGPTIEDTYFDPIATVGLDSQFYESVRGSIGVNFTPEPDGGNLSLNQAAAFVGLGWGF